MIHRLNKILAASNRDTAYGILSKIPLVIQTAPGASLECSYRNRTTVWGQGLNLGEFHSSPIIACQNRRDLQHNDYNTTLYVLWENGRACPTAWAQVCLLVICTMYASAMQPTGQAKQIVSLESNQSTSVNRQYGANCAR